MQRKISSKWIWLLLVLLFFIFIILVSYSSQKINYQGYVEADNLYLASPYEGKLAKKLVSRGQLVKKGEVLFVLDPNPEMLTREQLNQAILENKHMLLDLRQPKRPPEIKAIEFEIIQADATLSLAKLRLKRMEELYQKQAIDLDHVDEAKTTVKQSEAIKDQAMENLALAKLGAREEQIRAQEVRVFEATLAMKIGQWKLDQKTITASADGYIFDTYYLQDEFVAAGRPIAALLPFDQMHIEFFVPAQEIPQLTLNQKVYFECDGCQRKENTAILDYVSPEAEYLPPLIYSRENMDKIVFRIRAKIEQPKLFKPGQPVTIVGFAHGR